MSYDVVFNSNGGDDAYWITVTQTIQDDVPTKLNKRPGAFYRTGYKFVGWGNNTFDTVASYQDEQTVTNIALPGGTKTLYAIWRPESVWDIMNGIASAFSSLKKVSLSPAPSLEYDTLFHTMGWCCDRACVVYDKDTYLGRATGRDFYKKNDGFAIAVYLHRQGNYIGPTLISTVSDNATYYYGGTTLGPNLNFVYGGKTWYFNSNHHESGSGDFRNNDTEYFPIFNISDTDAARKTILDALNVRTTPYANSNNFYKGFEIGKALCNPSRGS